MPYRVAGLLWATPLNSSHEGVNTLAKNSNSELNVNGLGRPDAFSPLFREHTSTFISQTAVLNSVSCRNNYKLLLKTTDRILLMLNEHCSMFFNWAVKEALPKNFG